MQYFIIAIVVLFFVLGIITTFNFLRLKDYQQNIDVCEVNILDILNDKKDVLDKLIAVLNVDKITKLYEAYNDDLSMFEKEDLLFNINWEANKYMNNELDPDDEMLNDDTVKNLVKKMNRLEENLQGLREYYNANVVNYNEKFYKKPFTFIYSLLKLSDKKSFKLRKLEEYEILKN